MSALPVASPASLELGDAPPAPAALAAYPVAFDRDGRKLFGWYHPAADMAGSTRDCVVVMCNPIGYDAICTHRHYRVLAHQLAAAGFAVLRYDHHGCGDSSGSDEDPQRVMAWTNGVARAVEFARRTSGARKVALFGVRLGGTLALAAASADSSAAQADSVVAWAPFTSGSLYLREMRALRLMSGAQGDAAALAHDDGVDLGEDAAGYLLTQSTIAALGQLNLASGERKPGGAVLLLARDDIPGNDKLARHLGKLGVDVTQSAVGGYAAMMRDTFYAEVPVEALAEIQAWLESRHPLLPRAWTEAVVPAEGFVATGGSAHAGVQETPVRFGAGGHLFGMVSRNLEQDSDRARTAVLFVTTGSNHHIGPNRMYVTQARALAGLGFVAMRMDIGGVGESPPAAGQRENHIFGRHSVGEVRQAVALLRSQYGVDKVVLVGVCSGAYLSFRAAITDEAIASVVLINPQNFNWREGDSLDLKKRGTIRSLRFYRSRLLDGGTWRRILTGQVSYRIIVFGVASILKKRVGQRLARLFGGTPAPAGNPEDSTDIHGILRSMLQRGLKVFMVFSADDGGLDEVETYIGENAARLRRHEHFKFQIVDGADHTFTPMWAQRRLSDLLTQHLMRIFG